MFVTVLIVLILTSFPLALSLAILLLNVITIHRFATSERSSDHPPMDTNGPRVSVLIPVRNEESRIQQTLAWIRSLQYSPLEVLILDDNSSDATPAIVNEAIAHLPHARLVRGNPLPEGWLGKNFACHQLGRHAQGDILLFVDADVELQPQAIRHLVDHLHRTNCSALTVFPRQVCLNVGEAMLVPLMDLILFALLPIPLAKRIRSPHFIGATGQCFLFRRAAYERIGGHEAVRGEILEDLALARRLKALGATPEIAWGGDLVACRMYTSLGEAIEGFEKNIFASFGGRLLPFAAVVFLILWTSLGPLAMVAVSPLALVPLSLVIWIRALHGHAFGYGAMRMITLHVPSCVVFLRVAAGSVVKTYRRTLTWRGRQVR